MIVSEQEAKELLENMDKWEPMLRANYEELGEAYGDMARDQDNARRRLLDTIIYLYERIRQLESK